MVYVPNYLTNGEKIGNCNKNKLPFVLNKEQLLKLLSIFEDVRMAIVLYLGCFTGLRIGEIVRLKWSEISFDYGEIKVLDGKNPKRYKSEYGKDRIVPLNDMFVPVLRKWKAMNENTIYVIPMRGVGDKKRGKDEIRYFQKEFTKVLEKANMLEVDYYQKDGKPRYKYHLHTYRHVCGTNLYRAGMDIYQIKEYLGHEDIETTKVYCDLAKDDLKKASHIAYMYPKSHLPLPEREIPEIQINVDKELLRLQAEILDKKLRLASLRGMEVELNANMP